MTPNNNCYSTPNVGIAAPVIVFASSELRNKTTFAKSSGFTHLLKSAFGIAFLFAWVSIIIGIIQFTLIFDSFVSSDSDSTSLISPDLDAA
jgi:hypothetical protein